MVGWVVAACGRRNRRQRSQVESGGYYRTGQLAELFCSQRVSLWRRRLASLPAARHVFAINSLLAPVSRTVRLMVFAMALIFSLFPPALFVLFTLAVSFVQARPPVLEPIPDSYYMRDAEFPDG